MKNPFHRNHVTGVILAGGRGSRLSEQDKGLLLWNGKPLVEHVYERLLPQVGNLIISCNRNLGQYSKYCDALVADLRADYCGPLAGLEAVQSHIDSELVIVLGCDTPLVPANLVEKLARPLYSNQTNAPKVAFARHEGRDHYLCAAIATSELKRITPYLDQQRRSVKGWYETLPVVAVDFSDKADAFRNFNDWQDFELD